MSHKDNMDLRNTGDGGWFYAEHELFSVFCPLIGADGAMVYMAMCRLIPLAAVDPDRPVTVRSVSEASQVSKSTTQRKMAAIVALGMVDERRYANRRPSTFRLPSLRELAKLGSVELGRRLGVPAGDTGREGGASDAVQKKAPATAQTAYQSGDASEAGRNDISIGATPHRGSDESGVPGWDTEIPPRKMPVSVISVSQNEASVSQNEASVSQKRASVSQKRASVSQNGAPLKEEEEEEDFKELNHPPTPLASDGGRLSKIAASADEKDNGKSNGKDLPDEGQGSARSRTEAVAKVVRECRVTAEEVENEIDALEEGWLQGSVDWERIAGGIIDGYPGSRESKAKAVAKVLRELSMVDSGRKGGMAALIERSMDNEASRTDETPNWNSIAESMITARSRYAEYGNQGLLKCTLGPKNFFLHGIWRNPGLWMIDEKKLEARRNARIGTR